MISLSIKTIGVYGSTEDLFFNALVKSEVTTFCDIRQRRAVRGSKYAYVNSTRLQQKLKSLGINYVHIKELAPSTELRARQKKADAVSGVAKINRQKLSELFINGYKHEILENFSTKTFLEKLPNQSQTVCLFCVERESNACHRSLVAEYLTEKLNVPVENLLP
jgi:uncharacterized protein (DUF488 family)